MREEGFEQKKEEEVDEMSRNRERRRATRERGVAVRSEALGILATIAELRGLIVLYRSIEVPKVKHGVPFRRICL